MQTQPPPPRVDRAGRGPGGGGGGGAVGAQSRCLTQPGFGESFPEEGEKDKKQSDRKSTGRAVLIFWVYSRQAAWSF